MSRAAEHPSAVRPLQVTRHGGSHEGSDLVAVEAPLDLRLNGAPFATIMRTPGADAALAVGFLYSEGLVRDRADVERVEHVTADVVNVVFVRGRADDVSAALSQRRLVTANAACGVCGRPDLAGLEALGPVRAGGSVLAPVVDLMPAVLRSAQSAFAQTGGLHAAGLFDRDGRLQSSAEDVGRHNTVDKLVGEAVQAGSTPLSDSLLLVSGRASFEIVQKAWRAGIPLVAAVSAPSSLAVEVADRAGITLLGFVRQGRFNIYTHAVRIVG